jgi:hypothetical protein
MQDEQPQGFFNRGIIGLLMLFTIPALLTVGAMFVVIWQGRIPGGTESSCYQALNARDTVRLDVYDYQAGLSLFQTQKISVTQNGRYQELSSDTVQWPHGINCKDNVLLLGTGVYLIYSEKTVALSDDYGETWQVHNVCDDPRPGSGRCDAEPLNLIDLSFAEDGSGRLTVRESITDEYGQPLYENGLPRIASQWTVRTIDAGRSWTLESSD